MGVRAGIGAWREGAAAALLAALLLSPAGCGYRLVGSAAPGIERTAAPRVAIPVLGNDSTEAGVELMVTDALLREFLRRGDFRIVDDPRDADWVLRGSVRPLRVTGESFSSVILALEYTIEMTLSLAAEPGPAAAVPRPEAPEPEAWRFSPALLTDSEIYVSSADLEAMRKNREEALRRVSQVLAGRVHDELAMRTRP